MRLDPNPSFRKVIVPWYDSNLLCWVVFVFALGVFIFSLLGISIALAHPEYRGYGWVPILLTLLSTYVMVSVLLRLVRRRFPRVSQ